ncbi:hypothetical protein V1517DRAFT_341809 [Lipomyces orientalis]|uniref:Uncharacterized protein n=1 Tax=Lipomyces orientalis TaxID=1233043 RepID=A0ACC3TEE4_9ASCO
MSEKVGGILTRYVLLYFAAFVIGLVKSWKLTLGLQDRLANETTSTFALLSRGGSSRRRYGESLLVFGSLFSFIYCNYAHAFCQGSRFVASGSVNVGPIVSVLSSSSLVLSDCGVTAATKIFTTIDRKSAIDSEVGESLESFSGDIELNDVKFIYASRPDVTVLENLNLKITCRQHVLA